MLEITMICKTCKKGPVPAAVSNDFLNMRDRERGPVTLSFTSTEKGWVIVLEANQSYSLCPDCQE